MSATKTLIKVYNPNSSDQEMYDDILSKMVDNPEDISKYQIKPTGNGTLYKIETQPAFYKYVIITSNALKSSFDKFVECKKRKGIYIGVVTKEDIFSNYTGDLIHSSHPIYYDAGKIRQYLYDGYSSH